MLHREVAGFIQDQVNHEFYSAYLYLGISNYYYAKNLNGFGNWFKVQAREEQDHAMLFLTYLQNNGEEPILATIAAPDQSFGDFKAPLTQTLEHERHVTSLINRIYSAALGENDFRTVQFLDWFVKEQGEEEKNTDDLTKRFDLFGGDAKGLYMLDAELAGRVYAAPSLVL